MVSVIGILFFLPAIDRTRFWPNRVRRTNKNADGLCQAAVLPLLETPLVSELWPHGPTAVGPTAEMFARLELQPPGAGVFAENCAREVWQSTAADALAVATQLQPPVSDEYGKTAAEALLAEI
jgi:hypothetical protein